MKPDRDSARQATALPARVFPSPQVLQQLIEGQLMLLDLTQQRHFGLDEVGSRVWNLLSQSPETDAVVAALLAEYDVEEEQLRRDLSHLIDRLVDAGLVQLAT